MSMDSAMDSLSTGSDHSVASSNGSSNCNQSGSPDDHRDDRSGRNLSMNKRSPSPASSPIQRHNSSNSPNAARSPHIMPLNHPLSPPQVSTPSNLVGMPPRIVQSLSHLPPHGLGLLNSLQMMHHASPLDLMAAAHHHVPPRSYNSPPPISSSDPTANECKLVDYRGQKVAAFMIQGDTMLCLPQAFELFLKHLVGGLHTVYTKLKRLDIVPLVCNVEQVRILRGLGAIQPGVNRCKLLSCKDFDVLYRDCTTARCLSIKPPERPGRPPKRGPVSLSMPSSNYGHPQMAKKHRMDNGDYSMGYENGHMNDISRLDKSPLLANGYNAPPTHLSHIPFIHHPGNPHTLMSSGIPPHGISRPDASLVKGQNLPSSMEVIARTGIWENCRAAYEDIVKHLERLRDERNENKIEREPRSQEPDNISHHGSLEGHSPVLNLSKSNVVDNGSMDDHESDRSDVHSSLSVRDEQEEDNTSDINAIDNDDANNKEDDVSDADIERCTSPLSSSVVASNIERERQSTLNYKNLTGPASTINPCNTSPEAVSISSTETLLRNIQGLLKVAADNARQQERQITFEKAELKLDVLREREARESIDRQLNEERKLRSFYQRRYKREKRSTAKMREQLDNELKKRLQLEDTLKASGASLDGFRISNSKDDYRNSASERTESRDSRNSSLGNTNHNNNNNIEQKPNGTRSSICSQNFEESPAPASAHLDMMPVGSTKWGYSSNLQENLATGAFWQGYSESLAQELDLERKSRQACTDSARDNRDRDINESSSTKGSLSDRPNYYKNTALFGSAT